MPVWIALLCVLAFVATVTAVALALRARGGRARRPSASLAQTMDASALGLADGDGLGERATLVLFSTQFCSRCPQVRRILTRLSEQRPGVVHREVDLTDRRDLATRLHILQTPTTFVLDADGVLRTRIGGVPAPGALDEALHEILPEDAHV